MNDLSQKDALIQAETPVWNGAGLYAGVWQ